MGAAGSIVPDLHLPTNLHLSAHLGLGSPTRKEEVESRSEHVMKAEKRRQTIKSIISITKGYTDVGGKQGYHEVHYTNGDVYEGQWLDNKKHGQGIYTYSSGDMYSGKFRNGVKHGLGFYSFAKGKWLM